MKSFYAHLRLIPFVALLSLNLFGASLFTYQVHADSGCSIAAAGATANLSVTPNPVNIDPDNGGTVQYTITPGNPSFNYNDCPVLFNVWVFDGDQGGPDGQPPTTKANNFGTYSLNIPADLSDDSTIEIDVQDLSNVITGSLTVNVNHPTTSTSNAASPNTVNFGNTAVGQTSTQDINFNNPGSGDWTVTDVEITTNPGQQFSIDTEDCDTDGNTITSTNNCTIDVDFNPQSSAPVTGILTVSYDDANGNAQTQTYTLNGNGGTGSGGTNGTGGGTNTATPGSSSSASSNSGGSSSSATCGTDASICNPIKGDPTNDIQGLLVVLIKYLLGLIGIVAVLMIIWGGYQLVISAGNEEGFKKGKQTVIYAVAGLVLAVLSYSIVSIIENAIRNQK